MQIPSTSYLITKVINAIYPVACPVCSYAPDQMKLSPFCDRCWEHIVLLSGNRCEICQQPMDSPYAHICGNCMSNRPRFSSAKCIGSYNGTLKQAIIELKFKGQRRLSRPLARMLYALNLPEADCIIPVPMTVAGLRSRGYNHALLLAHRLSKLSGIPLDQDCLLKVKETPSQVHLSVSARLRNLKGAFKANRRPLGPRVLLVDDVITTKATSDECASALLRGGATLVHAAALARAAG